MNRRLLVAATACAIGLTTVACNGSDDAGPQPITTSPAVTAPQENGTAPETTPATESGTTERTAPETGATTSEPTAAPATTTTSADSPVTQTSDIGYPPSPYPPDGGDMSCLTADSPAVLDAAASLAPPNGRDYWAIEAVGQKPFPGCQVLQWVLLTTPGGTASSGYHVMFFHGNQFVSTANTFATAYTQVVGETDNSVSVQYRWLNDEDASCCPQGGPIVVTYTWDGSAIAQDPPLPDEMVDSYSH